MSIKEKIPLNFGLMAAWENWLIIGLMIAIPLVAFALIFHKPAATET